MAGVKRPHDAATGLQDRQQSPYLHMFEGFRSELDEHHDRRERIIKASRDITAQSKKMLVAITCHGDLQLTLQNLFLTEVVRGFHSFCAPNKLSPELLN